MTDAQLLAHIAALEPRMIELRRKLHRIPEPGFQEFETQRLIIETLKEFGIPYQAERTWVVGLIEGAYPGRTVALRADMDGLPVTEPQDACDFPSQNPGYMHACGHDAHVAIQLCAARLLSEQKMNLSGNVKLLFQPAEETVGGAQPMVAAGVLDNPRVAEVYGLHVMPNLPVGVIETRIGALNASTDEILITVLGRSGHGAYPDTGADAIVTAAQIVMALQTVVSRNVSPLESAVVSICRIEGGRASNVLCGQVQLGGTLRAATPELRQLLRRRATEVAVQTAAAMGCEAVVEVREGYSALVNHERQAQNVLDTCARLFGAQNAVVKPAPSMGGEDFSYFVEEVPGAFYHVGCGTGRPDCPPLHSERFVIDEACLKIGAAMQVALVMNTLRGMT